MESQTTSNYYGPHATKEDYDRAFELARIDAIKLSKTEPRVVRTAARIHYIKEKTLLTTIYRSKRRERNLHGLYNKHGGNNRVLDLEQEEVIRQYCYS